MTGQTKEFVARGASWTAERQQKLVELASQGLTGSQIADELVVAVDTVKGKYASEYDVKGAKVSEGIKEVAWSGGKLPDKTRETFVIETYLTDALKPNTHPNSRVSTSA